MHIVSHDTAISSKKSRFFFLRLPHDIGNKSNFLDTLFWLKVNPLILSVVWIKKLPVCGLEDFSFFIIFPLIGNDHSNWLILFRGADTTNQMMYQNYSLVLLYMSWLILFPWSIHRIDRLSTWEETIVIGERYSRYSHIGESPCLIGNHTYIAMYTTIHIHMYIYIYIHIHTLPCTF